MCAVLSVKRSALNSQVQILHIKIKKISEILIKFNIFIKTKKQGMRGNIYLCAKKCG